MYKQATSIENLEKAFIKASKHKNNKAYVIKFKEKLEENLKQLHEELITESYKPRPLKTFTIQDPKSRKISKSAFRDRVIHHAVCNVIEPLFDKRFIHDSYANRKGKGTLNAIKRLDQFKRKVTRNNTINCFVLKADIKHYFETVNHEALIKIIKRVVSDEQLIKLIKLILNNHQGKVKGYGMPLGNLTSQFFANLYLNELDQYVKHELRVKYYLRYVDDFLILSQSKGKLEEYKENINQFLKKHLLLELHPDKTRIKRLNRGIKFLGYRVFYHHKLICKKNLRKHKSKLEAMRKDYVKGLLEREKIIEKLNGWLAYTSHANTHKYQKQLLNEFYNLFPAKPFQINSVKLHENFNNKIDKNNNKTTIDKTLYLFNKGLSIKEIAQKRRVCESTIWKHITYLVKDHQIKLKKIVNTNKVKEILKNVNKINHEDSNEIKLILANLKGKNEQKSINYFTNWYQKVNCQRKCKNTLECRQRFQKLIVFNHDKSFNKKEFIEFIKEKSICLLPKEEQGFKRLI